MSNNENNSNLNLENKQNTNESISTSTALSDEQRVKVMSPSMLVFKRFIRNRLAVVGFIILAAMFLFSFVGPLFTPYAETDTFAYDTEIRKDYAEFTISSDWRFAQPEGSNLPATVTTTAILNMNKILALPEGEEPSADLLQYEAGGNEYFLNQRGEYFFEILAPITVVNIMHINEPIVEYVDSALDNDEFEAAMLEAFEAARESEEQMATFTYDEVEYTVNFASGGRAGQTNWTVAYYDTSCVVTKYIFHAATEDMQSVVESFGFRENCLIAFYEGVYTFTHEGVEYTAELREPRSNSEVEILEMDVFANGELVARMANYAINPVISTFLDFEFKDNVVNCVLSGETVFILQRETQVEVGDTTSDEEDAETDGEAATDEDGIADAGEDGIADAGEAEEPEVEPETVIADIEYTIDRRNLVWTIQADLPARLIDTFAAPSGEHVLGTDTYGMDVMTRLMYGGRVSLMVGFIVVFIELFIGVILGGLAGYFSGWVDILIMRLIELFNCIPFYPMLMIIGSVLDAAEVGAQARIYYLMVILGVLYWPGIARIVRGQILTLREQDFMVATEASGIPVRRRIFRHLLPNVIPLLIVQATMGLGGIIITEATLSFLGLGVKYPLASWGAIINQASNPHVMTNYWWVWLPAGLLILLTVLGFNFVGDGLRDAFDPKMKR